MGKFVLAPPDTVRVTVTARVPSGDGYVEHLFSADIKKLYGDEKEIFMSEMSQLKDSEVIKRLVVNLHDFYDESGNQIPFSKDLLDKISGVDYVLAPLVRECLSVQDENMRRFLTEKN